MKVFYHADLDGECSAAVVRLYADAPAVDVLSDFVAIDYKDDFPFHVIGADEEVWIVDFSLQKPGEWDRLTDITSNVVWIDHHKTAIKAGVAFGADKLRGRRAADGEAACLLTWKFCYGAGSQPRGVELISDFDTWTFKYGDEALRFQAYLTVMADTRPWSDIWRLMLEPGDTGNFSYINTLEMGRQVLEKRIIVAADDVAAWAFDVDFDGLRGLAINRRGINSSHFDSVAAEYEVLLPFAFDGRRWTVSVYRGGKAPDLDCSEIAKRYGGGGHAGAAGFQCNDLPFHFAGDTP